VGGEHVPTQGRRDLILAERPRIKRELVLGSRNASDTL
jgi:hypothetical protein